jgi:hypothetical protein
MMRVSHEPKGAGDADESAVFCEEQPLVAINKQIATRNAQRPFN